MKNLIALMALVLLCYKSHAQKINLTNGFYEVYKLCNDSVICEDDTNGMSLVEFNHHFVEDAPKAYNRVVIYTNEFVPLELQKLPELVKSKGAKTKLQITLTPEASAMLKGFSEKRVMKHVAIIMDGEVLTIHRIRVALTGPGMEITRCNDQACEKLQVMMKDNLKK